MRKSNTIGSSRLIERRGKSCGRVGYFLTSIVPGQETRRGFFTNESVQQERAAVAFRAEHRDRVHGPANT